MARQKTFYVTTPIYYPSGDLHIGHLYSTTIAWVLANYKKSQGYDVKFLTGSDEHGQKIAQKAQLSKLDPQTYVDQQISKFIDLWEKFNIKYDYFSRTTSLHHQKLVQQIFSKMLHLGWIYKGTYQGWYSVNDEEFIAEGQALKIEGKYYHPISNHPLELVTEESYFFKIKDFAAWLIEYIRQHPKMIQPSKIVAELKNNFFDQDLNDLSVTRISLTWGIPITEEPQHVIYVWLDALFNYLSALGFDLEEPGADYVRYWEHGDERVHIIGKEISRFHCIYWPIFLQSLGLKLPTKILSHGWLITAEGKMSKSKNNVINPLDLLEKFDAEVIKYYLVAKISTNHDGVFSEKLLATVYNNELVNVIGNLVSRTISMIRQNFSKRPIKFSFTKNDADLYLLAIISNKTLDFQANFDHFAIDQAFNQMVGLAKELNKYIDMTMPWTLTKELDRLEIILNILLNGIYAVLTMLKIVMPQKVAQFAQILNVPDFTFAEIENWHKFDNIKVNDSKNLFLRIRKEQDSE